MPAVPLEVEAEGVAGEVEAQPVAHPPGQADRRPDDGDLEQVAAERDGQEGDAGDEQLAARRPGERLVDGGAQQERAGDRGQHGDHQHDRERGDAPRSGRR